MRSGIWVVVVWVVGCSSAQTPPAPAVEAQPECADTNVEPSGSIGEALKRCRAVHVAVGTYKEDLVVPPGAELVGAGATIFGTVRMTSGRLAGFHVVGSVIVSAGAPVLEDLVVLGPGAAVRVESGRPLIRHSALQGADAPDAWQIGTLANPASTAYGVYALRGASFELTDSTAEGGAATLESSGARCDGCSGAVITDSTLRGAVALTSSGLSLVGDAHVTRSTLVGTAVAGGLNDVGYAGSTGTRAYGVQVSGPCSAAGALIESSALTGSDSVGQLTIGVFSACPITVRDSTVRGGGGMSSSAVACEDGCVFEGDQLSGRVSIHGAARLSLDVIHGGLELSKAGSTVDNNVIFGTVSAGDSSLIAFNHIEARGTCAISWFGHEGWSGRVIDNTLCGALCTYFDESGPAELSNNNLCGAPLESLTGFPNASGNISADPQVDAQFHLLPTSPNRGAGKAMPGGPAIDFDGQPRPVPSGTNPDIGPDEID